MYKSSTNYYSTLVNGYQNSDEYYSSINTAVVLAKTNVPIKHKQLASNYILIRKIFGNCVASIPITSSDMSTLTRHGFQRLENTTIAQMNRQIEQMKNWSNGGDILLATYANELFEIRIKELKYMRLSVTVGRRGEFEEGYRALEKYVEYIAQ